MLFYLLKTLNLTGAEGCELAFLALGKVGFVSGFCAPCHVLKIAWGSMAKFRVLSNRNAVSK